MNCPRCGKPIGGYVQAGSKAASYVSQGKCPHCGCSMPSGYKVGFANDFKPKPVKYDRAAADELNRKGPYMGVCTILNGVLGCVFSILNHHIVIGILFGVVMIAAAVFYYFLYAKYGDTPVFDRYGRIDSQTTSKPVGRGLMIFSLVAGLCVSLMTYTSKEPNMQLFYWIIGTFLFSLALQACAWRYSFKWARQAAAKRREEASRKEAEAVEQQVMQIVLDQIYSGKAKCGKCGRTNLKRASFAIKGEGAIILCDECFPWKKGGTTEIGGMTFYHEGQ